ncbi:recombinase family protein [Nocardioides zeae]|uniref:recombinase family protein n=1 Tax=Nocardioides zeae TaxID=1457234 RepID=UPI0030845D3E
MSRPTRNSTATPIAPATRLDRLARSRIDDAEIATIFHLSGTTLVSASEQIDDTPSGSLLHGIMAAIAEHYSKNLSFEAKKGMAEKARRGGTPGVAPSATST